VFYKNRQLDREPARLKKWRFGTFFMLPGILDDPELPVRAWQRPWIHCLPEDAAWWIILTALLRRLAF